MEYKLLDKEMWNRDTENTELITSGRSNSLPWQESLGVLESRNLDRCSISFKLSAWLGYGTARCWSNTMLSVL